MLKANGHIAVWWFYVCVFAMFVLACHRGLLEGYYFFIDLYMFERLRSLKNWQREAETGDVEGKRMKGDEKERRKSWGVVGWWRQQVGKEQGKKVEKGGALFTWKPPSVKKACLNKDLLKQAWMSWSLGHWIVLAISFISRRCNTLECVDK